MNDQDPPERASEKASSGAFPLMEAPTLASPKDPRAEGLSRRSVVLEELIVSAPEVPKSQQSAGDEPISLEGHQSFVEQELCCPRSSIVRTARASLDAAMKFVLPLAKKVGSAPPVHFTQAQVRRMELLAHEGGWDGPVLWYIPENITLEDLCRLGAVSERWWKTEPDFPRSMPTVSPYDETGYWVLWSPKPHPMMLASTWEEQRATLPQMAHLLGFRKGEILAGDATDLSFLIAMARTVASLKPETPYAIRTDTCVHLAVSSRSWFDHLDMVNVSLIVSESSTELGDYPNPVRAPFLGMAPLLY